MQSPLCPRRTGLLRLVFAAARNPAQARMVPVRTTIKQLYGGARTHQFTAERAEHHRGISRGHVCVRHCAAIGYSFVRSVCWVVAVAGLHATHMTSVNCQLDGCCHLLLSSHCCAVAPSGNPRFGVHTFFLGARFQPHNQESACSFKKSTVTQCLYRRRCLIYRYSAKLLNLIYRHTHTIVANNK